MIKKAAVALMKEFNEMDQELKTRVGNKRVLNGSDIKELLDDSCRIDIGRFITVRDLDDSSSYYYRGMDSDIDNYAIYASDGKYYVMGPRFMFEEVE